MTRIPVYVVLACSLANTAIAAEAILSAESYGDVVFGARLDYVEKRLGEQALREFNDPSCDFVRFSDYQNAKFMVEEGIVTRVDVEAGVPNVLAVSVGTPLGEVRKKHPLVQIEPHNYDPEGHYLIFKSADGKNAVVMEEGDGKVTAIRAGVEPSVEYVEGCL